jgi:hypothetical protein
VVLAHILNYDTAACCNGKQTVSGREMRLMRCAGCGKPVGAAWLVMVPMTCPATSCGAAGIQERHACKESQAGRAYGAKWFSGTYASRRDRARCRRGLRLCNLGWASARAMGQVSQLYSWKYEEDRLNFASSEFTFI